MKKVYSMCDEAGRVMKSCIEDGELKVTMTFGHDSGLTMEDICSIMGWTITDVTEYEEPKVIPFTRKD
jgi:hypothetical protein